jgi:hypothetical protein
MRLSEIAEIILENVERLLPHLRDDVAGYLAARSEIGLPPPPDYPRGSYNRNQAAQQWVDRAIEYALRSDPR